MEVLTVPIIYNTMEVDVHEYAYFSHVIWFH